MADKKISQLGATTTPADPDLYAIVQSGTTKKITHANLKAAILNSASLTAGTIPYWDGTNFSDSPFSVIGPNIVTTSNIVSPDVTGGVAVGNGGYAELSSSNFDATESFVYIDDTEASIISQGTNGLTTNATNLHLIHGSQIDIDAPVYRFSQLTASTVPYLDASKNLVSSSITPTELGYLSGVSSQIQTQINSLQTGQYWKAAVRVATLSAGTLATSFENGDTVDGVVLSTGDRILIKNQSSAVENGIYVVNASGAPTRATDFDSAADNLSGATVTIKEGSQAETKWTCSTNDPITIGVTNITFVDAGGLAYLGTTNRITVTGNVIDIGTDVVTLTGSQTLTNKTITSPTIVTSILANYATASTVAIFDVSKNLISADTSTYPSLTELSYGKGVTSSIQTQINRRTVVLDQRTDVGTITGTTSLIAFTNPLIAPANTLVSPDSLRWECLVEKTGATGTITVAVYINTSNTLSGATQIARVNGLVAATLYITGQRTYFMTSSTNLFGYTATSTNNLTEANTSTSGGTNITVNASADIYVIFAAQLGNASDSVTIRGATLTLRKNQ